jgi:hypothetical protein
MVFGSPNFIPVQASAISRFGRLREVARKGWIYFAIFEAKRPFEGKIEGFPDCPGKTGISSAGPPTIAPEHSEGFALSPSSVGMKKTSQPSRIDWK